MSNEWGLVFALLNYLKHRTTVTFRVIAGMTTFYA